MKKCTLLLSKSILIMVLGMLLVLPNYAQTAHIYNLSTPAKVMLENEQFAYIGINGKPLFDNVFEEATDFDGGIAVVKNKGKYALIDTTGKVIKNLSANEVFAPSYGRILFEENGKYGYYDYKGNIVIPATYKRANPFYESIAIVSNNGSLYGAINTNAELQIPYQYKRLEPFSEGFTMAQSNTKQWVYLNHKGNVAISDTFDMAYPFSEGLAIVSKGNRVFVFDKTGATIFYLPTGARHDLVFQKGVLRVYAIDKIILYDRLGNIID